MLAQKSKTKSSISLLLHLWLAHYLEAFHVDTDRRYGITYWKVSLITLMSFVEVSDLVFLMHLN